MFIGILGGGLSGVSLQHFLKHDSEVLEKEERLGGLCRTFAKDGFYYDIGGHILFSKDKDIIRLVKRTLGNNINSCRRNNKILFKDRFIKYPFENDLGSLDKQDNYDCLISYLKNNYVASRTFKDWIYKTFGKGIAEKYLIPYNEKIWKFPLKKMTCDWVGRIPKPPVEDVVKSSLGIATEGYKHQLYFDYPRHGGIESLVKAFVKDKAKIKCSFEIKQIKKIGRGWIVSDGNDDRYYDKLVLTIPVKEAVKYISGVPKKVLQAARNLRHNSVKVILVGINNPSLSDKSAIYIPDSNILAHRLCYMKYFSPKNAPTGKSSLIAEVSMSVGRKLYHTQDSAIIERVITDLGYRGIINKKDIITTDIKTVDYGYIVYDDKYKKNIGIIKDYFVSLKIELLGRFGEFEYINMDEVLKRSIRLAEKFNNV